MKSNLSFHDQELDNNTENIEENKQESIPSEIEVVGPQRNFKFVQQSIPKKTGSQTLITVSAAPLEENDSEDPQFSDNMNNVHTTNENCKSK